jgi:erythritol kinase
MAANPDIDWLARLVQDAVQLAGVGVVHKEQTCVRSTKLLGRRGCARCSFTRLSPLPTSGVAFIDPLARAGILGIDQDVRLPELVRGVYEGLGPGARECYVGLGALPPTVRITGWAALESHAGDPRNLV